MYYILAILRYVYLIYNAYIIYNIIIHKGCKKHLTLSRVLNSEKPEATKTRSIASSPTVESEKETENNISVLLYYPKLAKAPDLTVRSLRLHALSLPRRLRVARVGILASLGRSVR